MAPDASLSIKRSAGNASHRCRYKRWQLISIQFYRLQSKLLKRTTATDQNSALPEPRHRSPDDELPTRYCNLVSRPGLACLSSAWLGSPRGHCINERQHAKQSSTAERGCEPREESRTSRGKTSRDIRAVELPVDAAQLFPTTYVARKLLPLMTAITFIVLAITIK